MENGQNIERWNDDPGELETSYFYKIVKEYRLEQILYRSRCINFDDINKKIQYIAKDKLWEFKSFSRTEIKRCECGRSTKIELKEIVAETNKGELDTVQRSGEAAINKLNEAFLYLNEVYFAYLKVSRYINNFMLSSENFFQSLFIFLL